MNSKQVNIINITIIFVKNQEKQRNNNESDPDASDWSVQ